MELSIKKVCIKNETSIPSSWKQKPNFTREKRTGHAFVWAGGFPRERGRDRKRWRNTTENNEVTKALNMTSYEKRFYVHVISTFWSIHRTQSLIPCRALGRRFVYVINSLLLPFQRKISRNENRVHLGRCLLIALCIMHSWYALWKCDCESDYVFW